jgi:hypothetical protein
MCWTNKLTCKSRPKLEYIGVTQIGYPTSMIISSPLRRENERSARNAMHIRDWDHLHGAMDALRTNGRTSRGDQSADESDNGQRLGTIISAASTKPLPLIYAPIDEEPASPTIPEASDKPVPARTGSRIHSFSLPTATDEIIETEGHRITSTQQDKASPVLNIPDIIESLKVQIPPFLSWATSSDSGSGNVADNSPTSGEHVDRILESIHITLKSRRTDRNGKIYRLSFERRRDELEEDYSSLLFGDKKTGTKEESSSGDRNEPENSEADQSTAETFGAHGIDPQDAVHMGLLKSCNDANIELFRNFETFLSYYLSLSSNHTVAQKCWGAFATILMVSVPAHPPISLADTCNIRSEKKGYSEKRS